MKVKVFIFTLLLSTGLKAEYTENSFNCFDKRGERVFQFGEFIHRGGLGQEMFRDDRTDFNREFATELRAEGLFGFRYTGPRFENFPNQVYENNHRTLIVGEGYGGDFLYVFKPQGKRVTLEIWLWTQQPHYGHANQPGDTLAYKETFSCN